MMRWNGTAFGAALSMATMTACVDLALPAAVAAASPAPVWIVDATASKLRFESSEGGAPFTGTFTRWRADIRFDPKNLPGSSVLVKVDVASARTGSSERDEALPTADWFAADKFAQATFAAKTFRDLGGGRYQALGTLTVRGVTRPLVLPFTLAIQGNQARMNSVVMLDRHLFGIGQGQFAGADSVPFAVKVTIAIAAKRG